MYITTNGTIQTNFFVAVRGNATHPNSFGNPNVVVVYTYPPWILEERLLRKQCGLLDVEYLSSEG